MPGQFMSLFWSTAEAAKVVKARGWMKLLNTTLSTATGVKENLIDAPFLNPDSLSKPLVLVSPLISATPISVKKLE